MDSYRYAITIIKPDAHLDKIVDPIIHDIEGDGLRVVFRKDIILSKAQAKFIYMDDAAKEFFSIAIKSLTGIDGDHNATLLILKSENENAREKLQTIKGKANREGIRRKYRKFSRDELIGQGMEGNQLAYELAKNRLHVPDSNSLSSRIIFMLLNDSELHELGKREPELIQEVTREVKQYDELKSWRELQEHEYLNQMKLK